jgi:serine phosphatase RsbU (regulator of sigma subunit)/pSer/pThr/pTyr-binding forkhead associated (FHA) protein
MESFLDISADGRAERRVALHGNRLVVGRATDVELHLESGAVSRRHAELFTDPFGRWWIRDLGSRNGTVVNGTLVKEQMLKPGDRVQIEEYTLVMGGDMPGSSRPPMRKTLPPGSGTGLTLTDMGPESVTKLEDLESPKIDARHLSHLTRFSAQLLQTEDADERLLSLCRLLISPEFHGNTAVAFRVNNDKANPNPQPLCAPQSSKNWRAGELPYISKTILRSVLEARSPVCASNVAGGTDVVALSLAGNVQELSVLACPLAVRDDSMDLLYVTLPGEFGTGEWLALAALAAEQFQQAENVWAARALAQEQAIIEKELARARDIQMRLIPSKVGIEGIEVAIGFEPCKWVGGDYVDILQAGNGRTFVCVADVCGKGLQAALITATLHSMVHMNVSSDMKLTTMMERLNDYLVETLPDESFVTFVGLIIDPKTGELEVANAGHPPPFVIDPAGKCRELQSAANPPLGYMPMPIEAQTTRLQRGDLLALYTDGLSELTGDDPHKMLGVEGVSEALVRTLKANPKAATSDLATQFHAILKAFQGTAMPQDDHTFMLLRKG